MAKYYLRIADRVLPLVKNRHLTLVHCPEGVAGECRYLKHAKAWGPMPLKRVKIQEKTKVGEYLVAESISGVVGLVQMGIVEIHTWNSTFTDLERPNRIVWDLDPGPRVGWTKIAAAARALRDVLRALKLRSWVKTTGGRGLHVVVPVRPSLDWSECLEFSRSVAQALERTDPASYTTTFSKAGREAKILIDYLRTNRTNTSICAFSPRANPAACVSMPISWESLRYEPGRWTLPAVLRHLSRARADPWKEYWGCAQRVLPKSLEALNGVRGTSLARET